jgi:hypothetical protein
VTNKNKKRPSGYREPRASSSEAAEPARRRGLFDSILAPRVPGSTPMPSILTSLRRGFVTVASSVPLVLTSILLLLAMWLVLVALGYEGPFALLVNVLGVPPVGTFNDLNLSISVFGVTTGFLALLVFIGLRAIIQAVLTVMAVDVLQTGSATRWSVVRSLRILPVTLAVNVACLGLLMASSFIGPILGQGFGLLILLAALVAGVYLLGFAPVIAATERRGLGDTLGRSVRAGRLPGAGNLMFAAIYVVTFVAVLAIPGKPGAVVGVNPSIAAWVVGFVVGLAHVVVLATLAFRYLNIADVVPEAAPRRQAAPRGRRR